MNGGWGGRHHYFLMMWGHLRQRGGPIRWRWRQRPMPMLCCRCCWWPSWEGEDHETDCYALRRGLVGRSTKHWFMIYGESWWNSMSWEDITFLDVSLREPPLYYPFKGNTLSLIILTILLDISQNLEHVGQSKNHGWTLIYTLSTKELASAIFKIKLESVHRTDHKNWRRTCAESSLGSDLDTILLILSAHHTTAFFIKQSTPSL